MKFVYNLLFSLILIAFLAVPVTSHALDLRTGSDISIASSTENSVAANLYVAGGRTNVSTPVPGDLVLISGDANVSSVVEEDITIAGGSVIISGETKGDLRIIGSNVLIKGIVHGNTIIVGGDVRIDKTADLRGDILIVGGRTYVDATIAAYTKIVGGYVEINGTLSGRSDITTQKLIFGDSAQITGSMTYFSPARFEQHVSATVSGDVHFNQISSIRDSNLFKKVVLSFINFWILLQFITTLLLAFLLVFMFKVFSQRVTRYAMEHFGMSIVIGIVTLIVIPIFSVIFFVSLIGLPIAVLLGLMMAIVVTLSWAVAGIILGTLIKKAFKKEEAIEINFQTATLGVILLTVLQFVPFVGELTRFIFFLVAVGTMMRYIYTNIRFNKI